MKEWTREERYRALQNAEEIRDLHERIQRSAYRQAWHVQPVTGLSSDPNGFAWHDGKWHLFYQWCPWGAVHGLKYWYHVTSGDLIRWTNEGIGMKPDTVYDNRGVHSGSAISADGELYLYYTGNHRDENWIRTPYTCVAKLGKDGRPAKLPEPLFGPLSGYTEHQRDPKILYHKERQKYYIFLGAQSEDQNGCVLVYESEQLLRGWSFAGRLKVPGYEQFGGMWECPCIGTIGGKDILLFSPQYIRLPGRAENTNHNVYLIGNMDYDTLTFTPESGYRHLDYGFDFYAAQLAADTRDPDSAVLIAWMGLPDHHYPTEDEDWEGSLTVPRKLRICEGRLVQEPVSGIEALRIRELAPGGILPDACELEVEADGKNEDLDLRLFTNGNGTGGLRLSYNAEQKLCTADRTGLNRRFNPETGEILSIPLDRPLKQLRIFIDRSSVEIFFNQGEAVFTSHVYPEKEERHYTVSRPVPTKLWELGSSVTDDFVI